MYQANYKKKESNILLNSTTFYEALSHYLGKDIWLTIITKSQTHYTGKIIQLNENYLIVYKKEVDDYSDKVNICEKYSHVLISEIESFYIEEWEVIDKK